MILLIDSGNSRLKVGWLHPHVEGKASSTPHMNLSLREPSAIAFDNLHPNALGDWLSTLTQKPTLAIGVNVAGQERGAVIRDALAKYHCPLHWVTSHGQLLYLKNNYAQPTQLGPDRLVALLGVRSRLSTTHPPFVLASFGTATTVDTVGPDDTFIGGLIFPGTALMRQSLARGTAHLPLADGVVTDFPNNTNQAITSGIVAAQAGAVIRQWLTACEYYGEPASLYVAGGSWPEVEHEIQHLLSQTRSMLSAAPTPCYLDRPVLDGLALLAAQPNPQAL